MTSLLRLAPPLARLSGKLKPNAHPSACLAGWLSAHPPARLLQELVQRCGLNPKYEEVAREQQGGAARVHVKVRTSPSLPAPWLKTVQGVRARLPAGRQAHPDAAMSELDIP